MSLITNIYKKKLVQRYDKDGMIPYLSFKNFEGLKCEENSFINSKNASISYFFYNFDNFDHSKIILFLHGKGPGHTAYMNEIYTICKAGYKVLTLDYMGCDKSGGEALESLNEPTRDVCDLLNHLKINKEIIVVGHSLGAYTSINILRLRDEIKKGVIISGFIDISDLLKSLVKMNGFVKKVLKYEKEINSDYFNDMYNYDFLKNTDKKLLFIHSKDDQLVPYEISTKKIEEMNNHSFEFVITDGKKHNPNYTAEAVNYMNDVFSEYNSLVKQKKLKTFEEKKNYFNEVLLSKITEQDNEIWNKIFSFLKK